MDKRLRALIDSGHIPHALVIDGGTYEERLAAAGTLASALICEAPSEKPCGQCSACKKVGAACHPDVITVLPEDKKKTMAVDIIRDMRDDAYLMPNEASKKVYVIAKGETMQDYAQNALLKILEEPPRNVVFIILCTTRSVLLGTVLSRVAVFGLSEDAEVPMQSEEYNDALELACNVCEALTKRDQFAMLAATSDLEKNYDILPTALDCLELILRDALVVNSGGTDLIGPAHEQAKVLAAAYDKDKLFKIQEAASDIVRALGIYSNKNLTITRLTSLLTNAALS